MSDSAVNIIDETPISPSLPERRNSLEKHLQTRPEPQDLKDRHILLDTNVAPSIQATQAELARQKASDHLKKSLERRPERDELIERNILRGGINTAPALQAQAHELQKNMLVDNLEHKIQSRPSPERLIKQGILDREQDPRGP